MALTYSDLKHAYRLNCCGDCWGQAIGWKFALADEIHFRRDNLAVPDEWQFRPSPLGPCGDDSYEAETLREASDADLMRFAVLIDRLERIARINHSY